MHYITISPWVITIPLALIFSYTIIKIGEYDLKQQIVKSCDKNHEQPCHQCIEKINFI
jgi:hypothetical protein